MHGAEYTRVTAQTTQKKRIYVVDDEQVIASTLCTILELSGYEASMFFSAESAWAAIQNSAPDMVLSDVMMTGEMDGVDLAELLAATHPLIKVMLISGHGTSSDPLRRAQDRGFFPEIRTKPIAPKELLSRIKTLLGFREDKAMNCSWPMGQDAFAAAATGRQAFLV